MNKILDKYRNSQYVKNFSLLAGSELIAQSILIGVTPLLARIYSPADFGQYEFFKTSALLLVVIGFLNYDASIYTSKNKAEQINSILLSILILAGICLITSLLLFLFNDSFVNIFSCEIKKGWFWILPVYVFFSALTNLMVVVLTKNGSFKILSTIKIVLSLFIALTQLFFGWLKMGYWGLIYSTIIVQFIAFALYFKHFYLEFKNFQCEVSFDRVKFVIYTYWRLPLIVFPGNFLNNFVQSLPIFFLGKIDSNVLGYYSLARRIIDFPLKFVSAAVQRLYIKEIVDEINETGLGKKSFRKNFKLFSSISAILFLGVLLFTKPLLPLIFGNEWALATPYVIVLGFLFSIRFIFGSLGFIMILGKAPKIDIAWQVAFCIVIVCTFKLAYFLNLSSFLTITFYVVTSVILYCVYGLMCSIVVKSEEILKVN